MKREIVFSKFDEAGKDLRADGVQLRVVVQHVAAAVARATLVHHNVLGSFRKTKRLNIFLKIMPWNIVKHNFSEAL